MFILSSREVILKRGFTTETTLAETIFIHWPQVLCHLEHPATEPLWLPFLSQTSTGWVPVSKGTWNLVITMSFNPVFATSNCTPNTLSTEAEVAACKAVVIEPSKRGGGVSWRWERCHSVHGFKFHTSCNDTTSAPTCTSTEMIIIVVTKLSRAQCHVSEWWHSRRHNKGDILILIAIIQSQKLPVSTATM